MTEINNWQGPGIYEHYKGGYYVAVGLIRIEHDESEAVAYMTLDPDHREEQFYRGFLFTARPLNEKDGPDCWNSMVLADPGLSQFTKPPKTPPVQEAAILVPRFRKIA
jgi:hypothetical protein